MAIHDTSNNAGNQQQTQAPGAAPQPDPEVRRWSLHTSSLFGAPIGRSIGSEYLLKLSTGLTEIYSHAHKGVEVALITLDKANETALAYSVIVVCLRIKDQPNLGVGYHILIVEATGDRVTSVLDNINNQSVEILRVTGDAMDTVLIQKVAAKVKAAFPNTPSYLVDACVIPASFSPDSKVHMQSVALNAGLAIGTELELHRPGFQDFNLAGSANDSNLVCNIGFSRQQIEDAVGEPMRSDLLINFTSQKQGVDQRTQSLNSGDREAKVSELSGFIDLLWAPIQQGPVFNAYQPQQQLMTQKYAARLIITNLASNFAFTPAAILLSLVTSLSVRDDNNWIQSFRPLAVGNEVDLHDIGCLNVEANMMNEPSGFGTRIDTKADSFKLEDLGQLVAALIQPGLIISLDVPEAGPQTWYLSVFAAAANGGAGATDVLLRAANELTNGNFSRYFGAGQALFVDTNNRVHLGTWTDRNGQRRDIRDIDYLAVSALMGDRNPQVIREWSDTFTRTQYPLAQRLAARKKMIMGLTSETAQFNGFAQRVTFSHAFLDALARGCSDAGLKVRINTPLSGSDFSSTRGIANFVNAALLQPGQTFMSRDTAQQVYPGMQYGYNRW